MRITQLDAVPFHTLDYETSGPGGRVRAAELPFFHAVAEGLSESPLVFTADLQGRIHGELLGVALAAELEFLIELAEIARPAGIALAGDLYDHPELLKLGASGDVDEVYQAMQGVAPVIGVMGNHDQLDCSDGGVPVLDGDICQWAGLRVAGVGGIIGNPRRPMRRSAAKFQAALTGILAKRPELLLLHQGPPGSSEDQRGATEILEAFRKRAPCRSSVATAIGKTHSLS